MRKHLAQAIFALAFAPTLASAHAKLVKSEPIDNGMIASASKEITLTFNEPVQPATCKLTAADGKEVANIGKPHADGTVVHIAIMSPLDMGRYSLSCRVVGPDSHPINSLISFTTTR
jgi:copper transport protein